MAAPCVYAVSDVHGKQAQASAHRSVLANPCSTCLQHVATDITEEVPGFCTHVRRYSHCVAEVGRHDHHLRIQG